MSWRHARRRWWITLLPLCGVTGAVADEDITIPRPAAIVGNADASPGVKLIVAQIRKDLRCPQAIRANRRNLGVYYLASSAAFDIETGIGPAAFFKSLKSISKDILNLGTDGAMKFVKEKGRDTLLKAAVQAIRGEPSEVLRFTTKVTVPIGDGKTEQHPVRVVIVWDKVKSKYIWKLSGDCDFKKIPLVKPDQGLGEIPGPPQKSTKTKIGAWSVRGEGRLSVALSKGGYLILNAEPDWSTITYFSIGVQDLWRGVWKKSESPGLVYRFNQERGSLEVTGTLGWSGDPDVNHTAIKAKVVDGKLVGTFKGHSSTGDLECSWIRGKVGLQFDGRTRVHDGLSKMKWFRFTGSREQ